MYMYVFYIINYNVNIIIFLFKLHTFNVIAKTRLSNTDLGPPSLLLFQPIWPWTFNITEDQST